MTRMLYAVDTPQIMLIVIVVLLLVALIVLPMFTNKKRQKQVQELHNSIRVGDTVKTVGGIVGTIVQINEINAVDREFVLETGLEGSKSTMVFDFNAIYQVMSKGAAPAAVPAPAAAPAAPAEPAAESTPFAEEVAPAAKSEEAATVAPAAEAEEKTAAEPDANSAPKKNNGSKKK